MCGIAGVFSSTRSANLRPWIEQIIDSQRARGPDVQVVEEVPDLTGSVVLGHNRLKIVDLSPSANQPMWDHSRQFVIVFNGEIYNYLELRKELQEAGHTFLTHGDTEVILEAYKRWGIACVDRFRGMFAFGLIDCKQNKIVLVRDRFGKKPLYFFVDDKTLWFASTAKVLARQLGCAPNPRYLARGIRYLVFDDDSEECQYEKLRILRPGHLLEAHFGNDQLRHQIHCYYDFSQRIAALRESLAGCSTEALIERVEQSFQLATRIRLRADVPIGVALSGGLDSSLIASAVAEEGNHVMGFTFGHPDAKNSEGPLVKQLGARHGIQVHYIWPSVAEITQAIFATIEAQDAPFLGGSQACGFLVYQRARAEGVVVVLGGQGSDEAFMGYRKFQLFHMQQLLHRRKLWQALTFGLSLTPMVASELRQGASFLKYRQRYMSDTHRTATILNLPEVEPLSVGADPREPLWRRQASDFSKISLPTLLRYEDRNSMGNSIESRMPFLDHELVELGMALPDDLKLRHGYRKWVLRQIKPNSVPNSIRKARYKSGFMVNQSEWFAKGMGTAIRAALQERREKLSPWLNPAIKLEEAFSDQELQARWAAMTEAIGLIWMADRLP